MSEMTAVMCPAPTPNLNKALSLLQGEMPKVTKTKTGKIEGENKQGKYFSYEYSYADLGDVVADMGPLMAKHGLAFHCAPTIDPANRGQMILAWSLLHESGEERRGEWPLGPVNQKPQSLGSAITYGRRYSFTAATNIVLEDDDDGQRAQQDHGSRQSAGDLWDKSTPAPARQERPAESPSGAPEDDPWYGKSWLEAALDQAVTFTDVKVGQRLWREAAAKGRAGELTQAEVKQVHDLLTARFEDLKAANPAPDAFAAALARIGDGDWVDKVRGIADEDEARGVIAEVDSSTALTAARRHHIRDAVLIRWPGAGTDLNESDAA